MRIFDPSVIDKREFWRNVMIFLFIMGLMFASGGAGFSVAIPFAFTAFLQRKSDRSLFWMGVSIAALMGNQFLMPKDMIFMIAQRVITMAFGCMMMLELVNVKIVPAVKPFLLLIPYLLFSIISSAFGWSPIVSYLKLFLFFVVYLAYLGVANQIALQSRSQLPHLRGVVLMIAAFFIVGSIAVLPFPGISQLTGEDYLAAIASGRTVLSLFKGVTVHSQALGPMIAVLTTFIFADWLLSVRKFSWMHFGLLLLCPYLLYRTSSRTAAGSMLVGFAIVTFCLLKERGIGRRWRAKVIPIILAGGFLLVVAAMIVPSTRDKIVQFALKQSMSVSASDFNTEDAFVSRQGLFDLALHNFKKSPIIGNGFQVSIHMENQKAKSLKDYLTAPIEKGVWIVAVLEETGAIGMFLLLTFLIASIARLMKGRCYITVSLLVTFFVLNLGEFSMFSMSNIGGFCWMFIFIGAAFDTLRLRDDYYNSLVPMRVI